MTIITVDDAALTSPEAEAYFIKADRRVLIGLRAALEMLGVPLPGYARRQEAGRPSSTKLIARQYAADNPADRARPGNRTSGTGLSAQQRRADGGTGNARAIERQASLFRKAFAQPPQSPA